MTIEEDSDFFDEHSFEYEEDSYEPLCQIDGAVFNEEFVVYNVASTKKLSKLQNQPYSQ